VPLIVFRTARILRAHDSSLQRDSFCAVRRPRFGRCAPCSAIRRP